MSQSMADSAGFQIVSPTAASSYANSAWPFSSTASPNSSIDETEELLGNFSSPFKIYIQHYQPYILKIATIALPVLLMAIGIPSNALCARVWLSRELRHSSSIYLAAIAVADLALLLIYPVLYLQIRLKIWVPAYYGLCSFYQWYFYSTQYIPPLLLVAFSAGTPFAACFGSIDCFVIDFLVQAHCGRPRVIHYVIGLL